MNFVSLASSSAGNAYIVDDGNSRLLLECGLTYRKLRQLMRFSVAELAGCLMTHEHKDHSRCYLDLLKNGTRVFASSGTAEALGSEIVTELPIDGATKEYLAFTVGSYDVQPFTVFHDAREPVGFLVRSRADGEKLAFATDTVNLRYQFPGINILAVECNYVYDILERCDRLPDKVRHRITNSHMELSRLCGWLSGLDLSACRELHLLHLSDACSNEGRFVDEVSRCVPKHIRVMVCPK